MAVPQERIFLSHSSKDHEFCVRLVDDLRRILGNDDAVWYDASGGLHGGDDWWPKIEQQINARTTFIVVLSPDSMASAWVNDEINIAWRRKNHPDPASRMRIIPLLRLPCTIRPGLESLQIVNFQPPRSYETALQDLLTALGLSSQTAGSQKASLTSQSYPAISRGGQQSTATLLRILTTQPESYDFLRTLRGHSESITSVAMNADGSILASGGGGYDRTINLWNPQTGQLLRSIDSTYSADSLSLSSDGLILASNTPGDGSIWNTYTGQLLRTFDVNINYPYSTSCVALSADGQFIAFGCSNHIIKLFNIQTGGPIHTFKGHKGDIEGVALSANGSIIASNSNSLDTTVRLWNGQTGKLLHTLKGDKYAVESVALSADGSILASGGWDGIKLWNTQTGKLLHTLEDHKGYVTSVALSADGQILASGSRDKTIKLWNAKTGWLLCTLTDHTESVTSVALSADGWLLASGSDDKTVKIWGIKE